jgi:hypothetical protein
MGPIPSVRGAAAAELAAAAGLGRAFAVVGHRGAQRRHGCVPVGEPRYHAAGLIDDFAVREHPVLVDDEPDNYADVAQPPKAVTVRRCRHLAPSEFRQVHFLSCRAEPGA